MDDVRKSGLGQALAIASSGNRSNRRKRWQISIPPLATLPIAFQGTHAKKLSRRST
jgi:hypothetical protein